MTNETLGTGGSRQPKKSADSLGTPQPDAAQLRADIEETRQELGDTVDALAAKADVKARAQDGVDQVKAGAQDAVDHAKTGAQDAAAAAKDKSSEYVERVRLYVVDPDNAAKVKGAGVAAAGTAVIAVLVAVRRRRNARPQTPWEKAVAAAFLTGGQVRDLAVEYGGQALNSDSVNQVTAKAQQALDSDLVNQISTKAQQALDSDAVAQAAAKVREVAAKPDSKPRAQGAAGVVAGLVALAILRRAARRS
ncbi:MAG: DUF3618 domain-containing protein [Streptosporangiaceae bacterium]